MWNKSHVNLLMQKPGKNILYLQLSRSSKSKSQKSNNKQISNSNTQYPNSLNSKSQGSNTKEHYLK
jgi:hypothetical protein